MNNGEVIVPRWFLPALKKATVQEQVEEIADDAGFIKEISLNGVKSSSREGNVDLGMSSYNELIIGTHTQATNQMTGVSRLPGASYVSPQASKTYLYYDEPKHQLCVRETDGTVYKITLT